LVANESFQNHVHRMLGDARYALFQIAGTEHFDQIYRFMKNYDLRRDFAFDVTRYSLKAESDAKLLRDNPALPAETRASALKAVRNLLERNVGALVGTNQADFLRQNEQWLKELEAQ